MKRTLFAEAEIATRVDFEQIGVNALESVRDIAGGAIGYPHHWARLTVSTPAPLSVRIEPGEFWVGDIIYTLDAAMVLDLAALVPLSVNDRRWIAVLARGETATIAEPRLVELDADSEETVLVASPKSEVRRLVFVTQAGAAGPTPVRPALPSNECCAAWVLMAPTGVVSIEMNQPDRVKTLFEVEGRVTVLENTSRDTNARTNTLQTDLAGVASRIQEAPRPELIRQIMRDVAALRETNAVPDEARAYWYDPGLVPDDWAPQNPNWLARLDEGLRFPAAAERDAQLALFDPASPALRVYENLLMPAWTEEPRVVIEGNDGSINISQLTHTQIDAIERSIARQRITYGASFMICLNFAEWGRYASGKQVGERFERPGETFEVTGYGHKAKFLWVRQLRIENFTETYWEYITTQIGLNGSVYSQSWLQAQAGVLTSVDLFFTRAATVGDVHLVLVECGTTAAPDPAKAIKRVTIPANQLTLGWNKFTLRPSLLEAGKRYAWMTVTTGNHALAFVEGNKFAQGSMFQITDGAWAQGSLDRDFAMRLNFAKFATTRAEVEFAPMTLENGMSEIGLLFSGWAPGGTALEWEIRPSGATEWEAISLDNPASLMGLPALTRLRAIFIGTTDLHAAIVMDVNARVLTRRLRNDMRAIANQRTFGFSTQVVQTQTSLDAFDPAQDTFTPRIITPAGAVVNASSVSTTADPTRPGRYSVVATFSLPSAVTGAAYRGDLITTKIIPTAFLQDVMLVAI